MLAGQVIAAYGRHYLVETGDGGQYACFPRGKKSMVACGDRVMFARTADEQGVIEAVDPRSTLFSRSAAHRQKLIAANVSQLAIVIAAEPSFSEELINRCLVAAEYQNMHAIILLNKCDLKEAAAAALARLDPYIQAGYRVIELSALAGADLLRPLLARQATVLVGQSGMGKSTIINALFPDAHVATREISTFLASGRHTTTQAQAVPAGRRHHPHRLPRPAGIRPASPGATGHRSGFCRIPQFSRAVPFSKLPPPERAGLRPGAGRRSRGDTPAPTGDVPPHQPRRNRS